MLLAHASVVLVRVALLSTLVLVVVRPHAFVQDANFALTHEMGPNIATVTLMAATIR